MHKVEIHFIEFLSPGSFVSESRMQECVGVPKPDEVVFPNNAYAFRLHSRTDVVDGVDRYRGDTNQIGPTYYHPMSVVRNLADVQAMGPSFRILASNMECNKWPEVVFSRWGNYAQPYSADKDCILPFSTLPHHRKAPA